MKMDIDLDIAVDLESHKFSCNVIIHEFDWYKEY